MTTPQITPTGPVSPIMTAISKASGHPLSTVRSGWRDRNLCDWRHAGMYVMRNDRKLSLQLIGRLLNRHHTTVMSGLWKVERLPDRFAGHIARIREIDEAIRA